MKRGFMRGGISWLDVKLGLRMLIKYPGLTLVGGIGMATAIAIGAAFFDVRAAMYSPLPLDEGDRVVAIESWDATINNQDPRILHDFTAWKTELKSVRELGAYREIRRNLIVPGGQAEPVPVAEMTASGFRVARVAPLLGRHLVEEDERPGAPPVVVLGYDVWRTRFGGDPGVIGRDLRLGTAVHTIVGVMPDGFAFPVYHRLWTALQANPADYERRKGPGIYVFGRLAPGATLEQAGAELEAAGRRAAAAYPQTHAQMRPRVVPYTMQPFDDFQGWEFSALQVLLTLLLVVVCVNVAILVYARTATRQGEVAVRTALGASRRRIVAQLFVEALVLSAVAAAVGLLIARLAFRKVDVLLAPLGTIPFWMDFGLSTGTVVYVLALTVLGALIVGVVPALKATGGGMRSRLQGLGAGGQGMRLGKTWTVLIVAQVAIAVAALPTAVHYAWEMVRYGTAEPGFPADEYLTALLLMDREVPASAEADAYGAAFDAGYTARHAELARRLAAEPGVAAVTSTLALPGSEEMVRVEVEGVPAAEQSANGHPARFARVDPGFFAAFGVPVLAGRAFHAAEADTASAAIVVNQSFVRELLGGGAAVGRRVRYAAGYRSGGVMNTPEGVEMGRWYEIVGVVPDFPNSMEPDEAMGRVYHPRAPGQGYPLTLAVRTRGTTPAAFAPRLREVAAALDPSLRLERVSPLDEVLGQLKTTFRMAALAIGLLTLSVLLLSAAGIYALMSFTVAQRRREIGIRSALGADPRRILRSIFSRAARQLGVGLAVGLAVAILLDVTMGPGLVSGSGMVLLPTVAALMLTVGLAAAVGPARRGLRIQPMDALREE
jgi:putative ABC transport system permease protein